MTLAVILIVAVVVVVLLGQVFVRYGARGKELELPDGMAEGLLGVVGTLFSVLLGLLVAGAIGDYDAIKGHVEAESNSLATVFRMARGLPEVERVRVRQLCRRYAQSVVEDEWPAMARGASSDKTWAVVQEFWEAVIAIDPQTDRTSNLHQSILGATQNMAENRRARLSASIGSTPPLLWGVIIFGAIVTVLFTHFFTTQQGLVHKVMTSLVAVSLALNIWLLAAYNQPFSGELTIRPVLFQLVRERVFIAPDTASMYLPVEAKPAPTHTTTAAETNTTPQNSP